MKRSAAHQAAIDVFNHESREKLAYHHILTAIASESGKWGSLQRVGSIYDKGNSWVWQMVFSPRLRDAAIMETFDSAINGNKSVRCFFLADIARAYDGHSFESTRLTGKFQALYFHAVEMQRLELNMAEMEGNAGTLIGSNILKRSIEHMCSDQWSEDRADALEILNDALEMCFDQEPLPSSLPRPR